MLSDFSDNYFMDLAIKEAQKAAVAEEVPVGALLVVQGQIIAKAHNQTQLLTDVTAHAEILVLTAASEHLQKKYFPEATLYVTLEPCPMCAGALKWAQLGRLVYGAEDEKNGFMRFGKEMLHPKTKVSLGIRQKECAQLLRAFFSARRT
jgi:tRNA(adenine34) deaminase